MKKLSAAILSSCALFALATGCAVGEASEEDVAAQGDQALCENTDGVNAVMAGLAVAAGNEMNRFLGARDFQWNSSTGKLEISTYGFARCKGSGKTGCPNTAALIAMQSAPSNTVKFPGGVVLNPSSLRTALKNNWNDMNNCAAAGTCPQPTYDLLPASWEFGSCDVKYFFNVYQQGTSTKVTDSSSLGKLENNLIFLGYPENRMLNFYIRNGQPSVDPTGGLNEGGTTTSGSCSVACSKFSVGNIAGQCCSCNGENRTFARSSFSAYMYLCQ